jgi:cbb3-type cytochrome oxidase subunit 3
MFHRIIVEEWQRVLSAVGILLFFCVFIAIVIRTLRMPRRKIQHLASLPLRDSPTAHDETH